jgi:hypothetical protein
LNVATYKWKVHNGKIEIISFDVKFRGANQRMKPGPAVSVASFISIPVGYMQSTKSQISELFSERTSSK